VKEKHMLKYSSLTVFAVLLGTVAASAQFDFVQNEPDGGRYIGGPRLGKSQTQIYRAGVVIEPGAAMENILLTIPVPMEWKEQRILSVNEETIDAHLASQIRYQPIGSGGAMEMRLQLRSLSPARPLEIVVAFELQNYELLPPEKPDRYVIPKRVPQDIRPYLQPSPTIESNESIFTKMFTEITKDRKTDWDKVEALYSFVQNNVKYDDQGWKQPARGALALTKMPKGQWTADCKDMTCLFVALCRAGKIPARIVRVPEHCYAEFYLELKQDGRASSNTRPVGFWFPCQVSGTYSFGGISEKRVILQKGDSFPEPDNPRVKKLFPSEHFQGSLVPGSPQPKQPRWIREVTVK
jgi:hypothetical protein